MKSRLILLVLFIIIALTCSLSDKGFVIVEDRTPQTVIVIGKNANEQEQFAADELQSFVKKS